MLFVKCGVFSGKKVFQNIVCSTLWIAVGRMCLIMMRCSAHLLRQNLFGTKNVNFIACGCGAGGRAVASTPEICGSNPVIDKFINSQLWFKNCIEKTKIKKKRPGIVHFKKMLISRKKFLDERERPGLSESEQV